MNHRNMVIGIALVVILAAFTILATGIIPIPDLSNILGSTGSSTTTGATSASTTLSTTTLSNTVTTSNPTTTNPSNPFGGTTVGNASVAGLQEALKGNSGLSNFLSARSCGLTNIGYVQFCDTFPDSSLDASKWVSSGTITVSPSNVQFSNATMRTKMGFYYGKFATFEIEINPQITPLGTGPGHCQMYYIWIWLTKTEGYCMFDYSVWGFGRIDSATSIMWGVYWEQEGGQIRSHTRYTNFFTHTTIDEISQYQPIPAGITEYGINWNIDSHGAYVQFLYKNHGQITIFSKHTQAVPKTFLYLFAASNGTAFTVHRVIVVPAWTQGPNPLASLVIRNEFQ